MDEIPFPGELHGLPDLAHDLIVSQDLGIEAGRYVKQVMDGFQPLLAIGYFIEEFRLAFRMGAEEAHQLLRGFRQAIYFRTVAGG
jgi:hypothetical protein